MISREAVAAETLNVTCPVAVNWQWVDPRTASAFVAPGWHVVLRAEDNGKEFFRAFVVTPTNALAITSGLDSHIMQPQGEEQILTLARKAEHTLRTDIAFWRLMTKEKQ